MSASERLKALEVLFDSAIADADKLTAEQFALRIFPLAFQTSEALPELIAVVETAEQVTFYGQDAHRYNEWHGSSIVKALSALDAKLSVT